MKRNLLSYLIFLGLLISILYVGSHIFQEKNPTLNDQAESPDLYLKNAKKYASEHQFDRSLHHLSKAIRAMRIIEEDVDILGGKKLESAIDDLLSIRADIRAKTLRRADMNAAIANSLNTLALVELQVSETYAETNKRGKAKIAMKYALSHLEHSMKYSNGPMRKQELGIYKQLDSLLYTKSMHSIDVTLKIDKLVSELDSLLPY
ncbi:MAG: hypothetical protein GY816_14695 [Cytophagales bacterium]|nr:hypothetical protein [Cytophagales bacterium]